MKSDDNIIEYIEKYDDLTIASGNETNYIQLKRAGSPKIINENSVEFWNTLRNWSYNIKKGNISVDKSNFVLITMNQVDENSFLHDLKPEIKKHQDAYNKIHYIGKNSTNKKIKNEYYPEFNKLDPGIQFKLVKQTSILDNAPTLEDIKKRIKVIIEGYTNIEFVDDYYKDLFGWWRNTLQEKLNSNKPDTYVSWNDLSKIRKDLRNKYTKQILLQTITSDDVKNSISSTNSSTFVKQLIAIGISDEKIIWDAKIDHEMTKRQNDYWVEENESYDKNIKNFQNNVKENYSSRYNFEHNTITPDSNKPKKIEWGTKLYRWAMYETNWKISDTSTESYKRGVLHTLANVPIIGWHPYYEDELGKMKDV